MQSLFSNTPMRLLGGLIVFMVFLALASYASLNFEKMKHLDNAPATISVTGEGEVLAVPDIGQFTFSVQAKADSAEVAQEESVTKIKDIIAFLRESGVEEKDIKTTNYNLYPQYRWEEKICVSGSYCGSGERIADGFEVSQSVQVKIRDTDTASAIITGVGEQGATNISGLDFVIDDTDALVAEARTAAIADAKEQARILADELGVRIVKLSGFYEENGGYYEGPQYEARSMMMDGDDSAGFGGAALPVGEEKTTSRVTITYEIQ